MRAGPLKSRYPVVLALLAPAVLLALAPAAHAGIFTPESGGSPGADKTDLLYTIALYIGIVIFLGVEGILVWSLVKFRYRRGRAAPAQIRGNTPLEVGWTIGAAAILVFLTAITFVFLGDIKNPVASGPGGLERAEGVEYAAIGQPEPPGGSPLEIGVNGQQFIWRFDYPAPDLPEGEGPAEGQVFSYHRMVVPIDTTVTLKITSQDVAHSWWIPELGGKADAIPGHVNETWFKISEPGVYPGQCAELCGENHAEMRAEVEAVPVDEYQAWVEQQAADIREAQELLAAQRRDGELSED